ncbi:hypothetical protein V8C35DRAFT_19951 [Trichoderma chlorosporum]
MWLGWERMQPNFDAQASVSLPDGPLPCLFPIACSLPPISNFRTPTAMTALSVGSPLGNNQRSPTKSLPLPHDRVLRSKVLQGDEIREATLLLPLPKSRLASITRVMKQPREFATLVPSLSFAPGHRLAAAFLSCRLAPLTLIRHLVPPKSPAVHSPLHRHTTVY